MPETIANLSYCAGIIDGEGTITLHKNGMFRRVLVQVETTSREMLHPLESFGGTILAPKKRSAVHAQTWKWSIRGSEALNMISEIIPYMKDPKKIARGKFLLKNYKAIEKIRSDSTKKEIQQRKMFELQFWAL